MIHKELSDKSIMEINWMDFKTVNIFEDGSLILIHIDKFGDRDNSSITMLNPEEAAKLRELLNENPPTKA